jgi:hypothetical protein
MAAKNKPTSVVLAIMEQQGITNADMSRIVHVTPQTCYERLHKGNMKVNTLVEMLTPMKYKLVAVPFDKKVVQGEYEIG